MVWARSSSFRGQRLQCLPLSVQRQAPRHLAQSVINFKPPAPAGSLGSGGQP